MKMVCCNFLSVYRTAQYTHTAHLQKCIFTDYACCRTCIGSTQQWSHMILSNVLMHLLKKSDTSQNCKIFSNWEDIIASILPGREQIWMCKFVTVVYDWKISLYLRCRYVIRCTQMKPSDLCHISCERTVFKHEREGSSGGRPAGQVWLLPLHHTPLFTKMKHSCSALFVCRALLYLRNTLVCQQ